MNTETRGTLSRRGNISQITNAFVEEVNAFSNTSTGYIIVSYAASPGPAIRQHPDAPFKYQPEHCHPRFIRSGHIPVGNPPANMDQCSFLLLQ